MRGKRLAAGKGVGESRVDGKAGSQEESAGKAVAAYGAKVQLRPAQGQDQSRLDEVLIRGFSVARLEPQVSQLERGFGGGIRRVSEGDVMILVQARRSRF